MFMDKPLTLAMEASRNLHDELLCIGALVARHYGVISLAIKH